jgi:CTP synthase (UTP-ammonia lyase)
MAYADTTASQAITVTPLSAAAVASIQQQLQLAADAVNAKKLTGAEFEAALAAAVTQVMVQSEQAYGPGAAGQIASVILASTSVPLADIGGGLGKAAAQFAASNFGIGKATAQAVANEGSSAAVDRCARAADQAGSHDIARICEGEPEVTGSVGGVNGFNSAFLPPAPPPAVTCPSVACACPHPSCT